MKDNFTKIIQVQDSTNAHVIKSFLESNGIPVFIEHETLSSLKYALPSKDTFIDICVSNDFVKKSLTLLNEQLIPPLKIEP